MTGLLNQRFPDFESRSYVKLKILPWVLKGSGTTASVQKVKFYVPLG